MKSFIPYIVLISFLFVSSFVKITRAKTGYSVVKDSYRTEIRSGGFICLVNRFMDEPWSIGTYSIRIFKENLDNLVTAHISQREGSIEEVYFSDVDKDKMLELIVFTRSAGSGGYGNIDFYKLVEDALMQEEFPLPIDDGYRGHDQISIKNGKLIRAYPIYKEGDSNATPSGGTLTLKYDFIKKTWN